MTFTINDHETSAATRRRIAALTGSEPTPTENALDQRAAVLFTETLAWFTSDLTDEEAQRVYDEARKDARMALLHGYAYGHMHGVRDTESEKTPAPKKDTDWGFPKPGVPPTWWETALAVFCLVVVGYLIVKLIGG